MRVNWLVDRLVEQGANVDTYGDWQNVGDSLTEVRGWFIHHTASGPSADGAGDINYIWSTGSLVPEYNAYCQRSGLITVGCSGRANHAGKGGDTGGSDSGRKPIPWIPPNSGNSYTVCLALANNGVGEPYTIAQENAALMFARAVIAGSGCSNDHGLSHWEWTKRKIDPAGQSRWASGADMWNMDAFRAEVVGGIIVPPEPLPPEPQPQPPQEDWMANLPTLTKGDSGPYVERMQHLLAAAGFMNPGNVSNYDGVWGNGTDGAKLNFDNAHGLAGPDTDCGPKSWESLMTGRVW